MKNIKSKRWTIALLVLGVLVVMQACNLSLGTPAATDEPVSDPATASPEVIATDIPIVHMLIPADLPSSHWSEITDRDSSLTAAERRANGGENFAANLYERPFNANTMDTYFPDLDILRARLYGDSTWIYVSLLLVGPNPGGSLTGNYGVELDLDVDGRGDYLILAAAPGADWSTDGVRVWTDANNDVGGNYPVQPEEGVTGDGYETLVFDSGLGADPDTAWVRISPSDPNAVEIAFKSALIENDAIFTWNGWTERSVLTPAWYDYNDHFTAAEAGSPLTEQTDYYPAKALAELDNTCRWAVGFTPTGQEPGICYIPTPPTSQPTGPGTISGTVYDNGINGGLSYYAGSMPRSGITVTLRSGGCGSTGGVLGTAVTNASGNYSFSASAGTYCVSASTPSSHQTGPQTVTIASGGSASGVNFFYYTYLGMR